MAEVEGQGEGGKLLLVEDDDSQLRVLQTALRGHDYHSATFHSAEEALAGCQPLLLDAAILDMELPGGMDGIELGKKLKEMVGPELFLPVVIVSGNGALEHRLRAYRAGCDDFLIKPINHQELALRLEPLVARKRQREELVRVNEALQRAQENRSELAALVVHDLRNPMTAILGNVQLLEEWGDKEDDGQQQVLRDLTELGHKVMSMINGLLDVEELEDGILKTNRQPVDVHEFIHHFPAFYETATKARKLGLTVEVEEGIQAEFDEELIGRIIENLLDNAVRYAPRGGQVVMRASVDGKDLMIEVGNTGPEIPELERSRMFERYYRLESRRKGSRSNRGLGLYFCRLAAIAHQGSIAVVNRPELPACFELRLPGCVL
jgi:signal transduction histidine kinase